MNRKKQKALIKNKKNLLHSPQQYDIIANGHCDSGGRIWPRGQAVKTSPFHGGNTGSIPVGVTYMKQKHHVFTISFVAQ